MDPKSIQDGCWRDITKEFKDSVGELELGELLQTDNFTLLEGMSAIELMDPKMDSGMILYKSKREVLTLEQSIKSGRIKVNNLDHDELIGIMDETYACLVIWFEGYHLGQTVMTNLYLHDPDRIEDRCLRIFSQAILRLVDFIDKLVQFIYCIEEEDFFLNNGKFNLTTQISDQKILASLEDLCQHYEKLLAEHGGNSSSVDSTTVTTTTTTTTSVKKTPNVTEQRQQQGQQGATSDNSPQPQTVLRRAQHDDERAKLNGIIHRLRFTQNFLASFSIISKNLIKEYNITGPNAAALIQKTIKQIQNSMALCDRHLEKCLKFTKKWLATIELGVKSTNTDNMDDATADYFHPTIMGFEPLIKLKLLPPVYPRCPVIKSRPSTVEHLAELVVKMRNCISISSNFYLKSFNKSFESVEQFSKYLEPRSCVISRTFLQSLYLPNRITQVMKDELTQSISEYCEPLMQLIKKDPIKQAGLNEFLEESAKTFMQAAWIYGHNAARLHERYPDLLLSFRNLQYAAFMVNDMLKNGIIYSWTTYYLAKFSIKYIQAGLELEIFSTHEYPYVFWYLYDILYRNEREQLELAKQLVYGCQLALDEESASANSTAAAAAANTTNNHSNHQHNKSTSKSNQSNGNKKQQRRRQPQYNTSFHDRSLLLNEAYRLLTGGMFLLTYGLKLQGKIRSPSMEFTSEEVCFEHRFGVISSPSGSIYQAYKQTLSRLEKLEYIYREAYECFSEARLLFERQDELAEDCVKICKTNMVVAKILTTTSTSDSSPSQSSFANREVEFCFDRHPSFPTVKL